MNVRMNPYAAPSDSSPTAAVGMASKGFPTFPGRSFVAMMGAILIAGTAMLLCLLWLIGAIDLGAYGSVFLASLVATAIVLFAASRCYIKGARRLAVAFAVLAPCLIASAILLALHDAGVISLF